MASGWEAFWSGAGKRFIPWVLMFLLGVFGVVKIAGAIGNRSEKDAALEEAERLREDVIPALADSAAAAWDSLGTITVEVVRLVAVLEERPIKYVTLTRTIRLKGETVTIEVPGVVIDGDTVPIPQEIRDRLETCDALAITCAAQTQQIATVKLRVVTLTDSLGVMGEKYHTATKPDVSLFGFLNFDVGGYVGLGALYNLLPCSGSESSDVSFEGDSVVQQTTVEKCVGRAGFGLSAGGALLF